MDQLARQILETIHKADGAVGVSKVAADVGHPRDEVKEKLHQLTRDNYLSQGVDGDFDTNERSLNRFEKQLQYEDAEVIRDEGEILLKVKEVLAYPSNGTQYRSMRGAQKFAKWLVNEDYSLSARETELRFIACERCLWSKAAYVHRGRLPKYCPDCGGFGTLDATTIEQDEDE